MCCACAVQHLVIAALRADDVIVEELLDGGVHVTLHGVARHRRRHIGTAPEEGVRQEHLLLLLL